MSTRSRIAVKRDNGYESIYCHSDGYPSGVGKTLKTHYTTQAKVDELIALADLSYLGDTTSEEDTRSYNRWRNEGTTTALHPSLDELKNHANDTGADYFYLFEDGKWTTFEGDYQTSGWKII